MEKCVFLSSILCLFQIAESLVIPDLVHTSQPILKGCCYGDQKFDHKEVVLTLPKVCLRLVCNDGAIEADFLGEPGQTNCCEFDGLLYAENSDLPLQCFSLVCRRGGWVTNGTIHECCEHCTVFNDPHLRTFDLHRYDWHGTCNYSVAQPGFSHAPKFGVFSDFTSCNGRASCLDRTTFKDNPNTVIVLDHSAFSSYIVNGELQSITSLGVKQVQSSQGVHPVLVWKADRCLAFIGSSKLSILLCRNRLDVWTHPTHNGNLNGLCGHYNSYKEDDFTTRNNVVEPLVKFPLAFPSSWLTSEQSDPGCDDPCRECFKSETEDPCEATEELKRAYLDKCRKVLQPKIGSKEELLGHIECCASDICLIYQNGGDDEDVEDWLRQLMELVEMSVIIANGNISDPCFKGCTRILDPVCGTDGRTYSNPCLLDIAICKNKCLDFKHKGRCSPECPIQICTLEYDPMCGTDGVTYSNNCHLQSAKCNDPCLDKRHDGECVLADCNLPCAEIFSPVCGSGKTYSNKCEFDNAVCANPCIELKHEGQCERECPIVFCTKELKPVCGTDGVTYDNECLLEQAQCGDPCILKAFDGPCFTGDPRLSIIDARSGATPSRTGKVMHSEHAINAENAVNAANAVNAENSVNAENARHAVNAEYAKNAANAENAENAKNAKNAENAVHAINAMFARNIIVESPETSDVESTLRGLNNAALSSSRSPMESFSTSTAGLSSEVCDCLKRKKTILLDARKDLTYLHVVLDKVFAKAGAALLKLKEQPLVVESFSGEAAVQGVKVFWSKFEETMTAASAALNSISALSERSRGTAHEINGSYICSMADTSELSGLINDVFNEILQVEANFDNQEFSQTLVYEIIEKVHHAMEELKDAKSRLENVLGSSGFLCPEV